MVKLVSGVLLIFGIAVGAWFGMQSARPADLNVLFIGNSYTHSNDMPGTVIEIAAANGVKMDATMIAPGGRFLTDHLADREVVDAIASGEFDFVVLQEQSVAPAHLGRFEAQTLPAAKILGQHARESMTPVVWFETWGHRNGSGLSGHFDYPSMQLVITESYSQIAAATGWPVARVGTAWSDSLAASPDIVLHDADGSHPTEAGSYLAALVLADALLDVPINDGGGILDRSVEDALFVSAGL